MNIPDLHKALHPKFAPYSGSPEEYSHRIGTEMSLAIQKASDGTWVMIVYERGQQVSQSRFESEADVCGAAFAFAKET